MRKSGDLFVLTPKAIAHMQARDALPAGTRIMKQASEPNDSHENGAGGTVRGSVHDRDVFAYFIEWDDMPGIVVGTMARKVRAAE